MPLNIGLRAAGIGKHRAAGGGVTLLAHTAVAATGFSNTVTSSAIDTTGADFLVVVGQSDTDAGVITDSKPGNTWNRQSGGSNYGPVIYWCVPGVKVGTGHTFTMTSAGSYTAALAVAAFSGMNASPFSSEVNYGMSYPLMSAGYVSPAVGDLVITGIAGSYPSTVAGATVDSNFTISDYADGGGGVSESHVAMAYLIVAGVSAEDPEAWDATVTYQQGACVRYSGVNYIYSAFSSPNLNHNPATSGWWTVASGTVAPTWNSSSLSSTSLVTACFAHA